MEPDAKVDAEAAAARLDDARRRLVELAPGLSQGAALIREETEAERDLMVARDQDRASVELQAGLEAVAAALGQRPPHRATPLGHAVAVLSDHVASRIALLEERSARRAAGRRGG